MTADPLVERMRVFGTTIFTEMSALAVRTGSINLGFPGHRRAAGDAGGRGRGAARRREPVPSAAGSGCKCEEVIDEAARRLTKN